MKIELVVIFAVTLYIIYINYNKIAKFTNSNLLTSDGFIKDNEINTIKDQLNQDIEYKFKQSSNISDEIKNQLGDIKIPELENFNDYAPQKIIKFSTYAFKKQPPVSDNKEKSSLLTDNDDFHKVEMKSEMTTQWNEKTSKNAHSHYFKLMDTIPRIKIPFN